MSSKKAKKAAAKAAASPKGSGQEPNAANKEQNKEKAETPTSPKTTSAKTPASPKPVPSAAPAATSAPATTAQTDKKEEAPAATAAVTEVRARRPKLALTPRFHVLAGSESCRAQRRAWSADTVDFLLQLEIEAGSCFTHFSAAGCFIQRVLGSQQQQQQANNYQAYQNSLVKLGTFNTVEGFWRSVRFACPLVCSQSIARLPVCRYYCWLKNPEEFPKDHDLYLMRNDLFPAWEVRSTRCFDSCSCLT